MFFFVKFEQNEHECLFETKHANIDFSHWDSYRLFYENFNHGYLSISYKCHTKLRKKYSKDNHLDFLGFIRINIDLPITHQNQTNIKSSKLMKNYRQRFRKSFMNSLLVVLSD